MSKTARDFKIGILNLEERMVGVGVGSDWSLEPRFTQSSGTNIESVSMGKHPHQLDWNGTSTQTVMKGKCN